MFWKTRKRMFWSLIAAAILGVLFIIGYFYYSIETYDKPGSNPSAADSAAVSKPPENNAPGDPAK